MRGLSPKARRYCELLCADISHNKTRAGKEAGFVGDDDQILNTVLKLERDTRVTGYITELLREHAKHQMADAAGVMNELWRTGSYDPAEVVNDLGAVKSLHQIPEHTRRAIESIQVEELYEYEREDGKIRKILVGFLKKVKFAQKVGPLNTLAKHFKLINDMGDLGKGIGRGLREGATSIKLPEWLEKLPLEKKKRLVELINE